MVDNNSSDHSAKVVKKYDFVTLIEEKRQGVIHARTTGFDSAKGDIIGRIDADTILSPNWVESVSKVFEDKTVDAVSGKAYYMNTACAEMLNSIDLYFRRMLARRLGERVYLWGANMAIRRSSWDKSRPHICHKGFIHEDFDLAIHVQEQVGKVVFDERMEAFVSSRRIDVGFLNFMKYVLVSPQTYAEHSIRQRWHMYWVVLSCAIGYFPARILHRGYNPVTEKFSLTWLLTNRPTIAPRIDPTSNVA